MVINNFEAGNWGFKELKYRTQRHNEILTLVWNRYYLFFDFSTKPVISSRGVDNIDLSADLLFNLLTTKGRKVSQLWWNLNFDCFPSCFPDVLNKFAIYRLYFIQRKWFLVVITSDIPSFLIISRDFTDYWEYVIMRECELLILQITETALFIRPYRFSVQLQICYWNVFLIHKENAFIIHQRNIVNIRNASYNTRIS